MNNEVQKQPSGNPGLWAGIVSTVLGIQPKAPKMTEEERLLRRASGGELPRSDTIDLSPSEFKVINDDQQPNCDECSCDVFGKCCHPLKEKGKCPKINLFT